MKLEKHKEKVAPMQLFLFRVFRYALVALAMIVVSMGIGMAGYAYFADLGLVDSLYMASMILTGMGPVSDMPNDAAKVFSSFYALYSGVAFLSMTAVFFAPIIHRVLHILHVEDGG